MPHIIDEAKGHPAATLKYKGIVDYDGLSTYLIKWMADRHYKVTEKVHKHKMSCPHGFEIEREFEGERKIDEYFMYKIMIAFHTWDSFEVDAVKDGKKVKLWNMRIDIQINFDVVCDYTDKWGQSPVMEKLRNFYDGYIIKKEIIIKHADPLYYSLLGLHTNLKKFMGMETATKF
jgi:hypothetical protein